MCSRWVQGRQHSSIDSIACTVANQVFVANPKKPKTIVNILAVNKEKLVKYLSDFHTDRGAQSVCNVACCACPCPR